MIPELIGRTPIILPLQALSKTDLAHILCGVEHSILANYQELFALDGIVLTVTEDAVSYISELAFAKGLGARGLISIVDQVMYPLRYQSLMTDCDTVCVDAACVKPS